MLEHLPVELFKSYQNKLVAINYEEEKKQPIIKEFLDNYIVPHFIDKPINLLGHNNSKIDGLSLQNIIDNNNEDLIYLYKSIYDHYRFTIEIFFEDMQKEDIDADLTTFVKSFSYFLGSRNTIFECKCKTCGQTLKLKNKETEITLDTQNKQAFLNATPCLFSQGIDQYSIKIENTSGRWVFANTLIGLFSNEVIDQCDKYIDKQSGFHNTINNSYGKQLHTEYWSQQGLMCIFVGNSCPNLYLNREKQEIIAGETPDTHNYIDLGMIITDLWAVCGMDYTHFSELCQSQNLDVEKILSENSVFIADMSPGTYEITCYNFNNISTRGYFSIKKIE